MLMVAADGGAEDLWKKDASRVLVVKREISFLTKNLKKKLYSLTTKMMTMTMIEDDYGDNNLRVMKNWLKRVSECVL